MAETRVGNLQAISQKPAPNGGSRWSVMVAGDWAGAFTNKMTPETQALLAGLKKGDPVEVQIEKNKNGYWELVGIRKTSYEQAQGNGSNPEPPAQEQAPATPSAQHRRDSGHWETMPMSYIKDEICMCVKVGQLVSGDGETDEQFVARLAHLTILGTRELLKFWENRQN